MLQWRLKQYCGAAQEHRQATTPTRTTHARPMSPESASRAAMTLTCGGAQHPHTSSLPPLDLHLRKQSTPRPPARRRSAEQLGLRQGVDYVHVCLGDDFANLISNLANETRPADVPRCDVGLASITETSQRKERGIEFSQVTYRNKLAVLVVGKVISRGMWAFFQPLSVSVWLCLLGTIFVVPLFVFLCEYVIMRRCAPSCTSPGTAQLQWPANCVQRQSRARAPAGTSTTARTRTWRARAAGWRI